MNPLGKLFAAKHYYCWSYDNYFKMFTQCFSKFYLLLKIEKQWRSGTYTKYYFMILNSPWFIHTMWVVFMHLQIFNIFHLFSEICRFYSLFYNFSPVTVSVIFIHIIFLSILQWIIYCRFFNHEQKSSS